MKTDKELLELAALAAGLNSKWFKVNKWKNVKTNNGAICKMHVGYEDVFGTHHKKPWNPLTDDGDALRLAVKLDIDVMPKWGDNCVCVTLDGDTFDEPRLPDVYASMRRAIVRAAVAIGEKL